METNLKNRVRNLRFGRASRLTPLFEAVSNSLHAIAARDADSGFIRIAIERSPQKGMAAPVGETLRPIDTVTIIDNGEGFTEPNFKAFQELDTGIKQQLGSKGIGRLFWLKVFEKVIVESVFEEGGLVYKRTFNFGLPDGITGHSKQEIDPSTCIETKVVLHDLRKEHLRSYKIDASSIAQAILQHFLSFFVTQFMPDITVLDADRVVETKNKNDLPSTQNELFDINGVAFRLIHMKLPLSNASSHAVYFCASDRVVKSKTVSELLGNFTRQPLVAEEQRYFYAGYVLSEELTDSVSAERDEFQIEEKPENLFGHNRVSLQEIESKVALLVARFLENQLKVLRDMRDARVEKVFLQTIPELSYLKRIHATELENVPFDAKEVDIAFTASRAHFDRRRSAVEKLDHTLKHLEARNIGDFDTFRNTFSEQIRALSEVSHADLSAYMLYRQRILALMLKMVQFPDDDSEFEKEKAIHSLFFPRFQDSEDAKIYDGHNLWLLDESLAFESYIASDVKLSNHKLLIADSESRPDIVAYGIHFGIDVPGRPFDHITIIEMKRPGRKLDKNFNPIQQIYNYIDDVRNGKIRDFNGLEIKTNAQTRFTGIVLCDTVNESVRVAVRREKLILESDGLSYHGSNTDYNLYIRVLPFRQVYEQARLRLKNFFDRMGLSDR